MDRRRLDCAYRKMRGIFWLLVALRSFRTHIIDIFERTVYIHSCSGPFFEWYFPPI